MATLLLPAFCDHLRRQADVLCDLSLITGTYAEVEKKLSSDLHTSVEWSKT